MQALQSQSINHFCSELFRLKLLIPVQKGNLFKCHASDFAKSATSESFLRFEQPRSRLHASFRDANDFKTGQMIHNL